MRSESGLHVRSYIYLDAGEEVLVFRFLHQIHAVVERRVEARERTAHLGPPQPKKHKACMTWANLLSWVNLLTNLRAAL